MSTWHIFRAVASKKAGDIKGFFKKKKLSEPVDKKLPFNLHIGSSISLDQTIYIAYGDKMKMTSPGKECIVGAYGKADIYDSLVHRFYLYDVRDKNNSSFLQIVTGMDNPEIQECRLFKPLDEIFPENEEEWGFWLDDAEGYIGWHTFEDKSGNLYDRIWGEEDAERSEPVCFSETVYIDKYGENVSIVDNTAMLYGTWIDEEEEIAELALLSAEQSGHESAVVHIYTGIDVMPESFNVNY
jgi:hypothetical protein